MKSIKKFILAILPFIGLIVSGNAFGQATITASPNTLCFGCVLNGTSSPSQTTIVSGAYLTPSSGAVTVTAPSCFDVYDPGSSSWVVSYTIAYSGGFLPSTPVQVQFNPPATTAFSGNVTFTGGGVSSAYNVAVTGNGVSSISSSCTCSGTPTPGHIVATDTSGCSPYPSTLTLDGFCMSPGISFQWQSASSSGGSWSNIYGATNSSFSLTVGSSMYLKCVVACSSGGGTASTSPIHLAIAMPPTVYPIVGASTVAVYSSITLVDATIGGTWSSSNPSIATVTAAGSVFGLSTGTATISYSVTDSCGTTVVTKAMTVTGSLYENVVPGANNGLTVTLSPNPASDQTSVSCTLNGEGNISIGILDLTGRVLHSKDAYVNQRGNINISLADLAPGVYLVETTDGKHKLVNKLVKE